MISLACSWCKYNTVLYSGACKHAADVRFGLGCESYKYPTYTNLSLSLSVYVCFSCPVHHQSWLAHLWIRATYQREGICLFVCAGDWERV